MRRGELTRRCREAARAKEDKVKDVIRGAGGRVVSDRDNENGRFIDIVVPLGTSPRLFVKQLRGRLSPYFKNVSMGSVWQDEISLQGWEKKPPMSDVPRTIHKSASFGRITYFKVRPEG